LDSSPSDLTLPRPFRFEEFWTFDASCNSVISRAWVKNFQGSYAFILLKKLKATKSALKYWNSQHFGNIQKKISSSLSQLDFLQQSAPSPVNFEQEGFLQKYWMIFLFKKNLCGAINLERFGSLVKI
jgi:hypothetical protein